MILKLESNKGALKKNLHVFCEKPPAKNVKDLKSVIKIEKKI